jgi:hypothetical protein
MIKSREEFACHHKFWYFLAKAARKFCHYDDAVYAIQTSLDRNPSFVDAKAEYELVNRLLQNPIAADCSFENYELDRNFLSQASFDRKFYDII